MTAPKKKKPVSKPLRGPSGRTWFGDILCEFWGPAEIKKATAGKVMILVDGVPSVPSKRRVAETLAKKGYWVFHMRYRGAWESRGTFLKHPPSDDVLITATGVRAPFVDMYSGVTYSLEVNEVIVIGASFGGAAAVIASTHLAVDKAIALAPVIDFTVESKDEPHAYFVHMLVNAFGSAYRPAKNAYDKLIDGKFYQPAAHADHVSNKKLFIAQAKDDKVIPLKPLREFAKKTKIKPLLLEEGGHYGAGNILDKEIWNEVKLFLKQ
jgi:pimeloyl-ACP methyl ester carboxylesterase